MLFGHFKKVEAALWYPPLVAYPLRFLYMLKDSMWEHFSRVLKARNHRESFGRAESPAKKFAMVTPFSNVKKEPRPPKNNFD